MRILLLKIYYLSVSIFLLLIEPETTNAQKFYGTTSRGGPSDKGTIISYDPNSNTLSKEPEYSFFTPFQGINPRAKLIEYEDILYGTTIEGGEGNCGVLFAYDPARDSYQKLFDFMPILGKNPVSGLTLYNGLLYGTTRSGGVNNNSGTLFSFDPATKEYEKIFDFEDSVSGSHPVASLIIYNGLLYGTTETGGTNDNGTLFSYDPTNKIYDKLMDFNENTTGHWPSAMLVTYDGILYGTTSYGGANGSGTIFSYDPQIESYTKLLDFENFNMGHGPTSALSQYNGLLYGVTESGGVNNEGVLYSIDPKNMSYQKLYDFDRDISGYKPSTSMIVYNDILYGTTRLGGNSNSGTLFSFDITNDTLRKIIDFDYFDPDSSGSSPYATLLLYNGLFYGTTFGGGISASGVLFSFDPVNEEYDKIFDFNDTAGIGPNALTFYDGLLYGITKGGGISYNSGTLYSFDPVTGIQKKLFDFSGFAGRWPSAPLTLYNGLLYGTTRVGATNNNNSSGTLFSFDPITGDFKNLFNFDRSTSGSEPTAAMTSFNGLLYGTTETGGVNNDGTLFSFDPANGTHQKLFDFNDSISGNRPSAALSIFNDKLYGTTKFGGDYGSGTIFTFDPADDIYQKLFDFNDSISGVRPSTALTPYNGILYGTTTGNSFNDEGCVLFSFDPDKGIYQELFEFVESISGIRPSADLKLYNGILYGTAEFGGEKGYGTLFSFDPMSNYFRKIKDISMVGGAYPSGSLTLVDEPDTLTLYGVDITETNISLNWEHSNKIVSIEEYEVFRLNAGDSISLGTTIENYFDVDSLIACSDYSFLVMASDTLGYRLWSNILEVSTHDNTPPIAPTLDSLIVIVDEIDIPVPQALDFCDGIIEGKTSDSIDLVIPGHYTITWTFTDINGNRTQSTQEITVNDNITSISKGLYNSDIILYPNPIQNENTTIEVSRPIGKTKIEVYDSSGEKLITKLFNDGTLRFNIETRNLKKGLYILLLDSDKGTAVWKLVKK